MIRFRDVIKAIMSGWFLAGALQAFMIIFLALFMTEEDAAYRFFLKEQPAWKNIIIILPFIGSNIIAIYTIVTGRNNVDS